MRPKLRFSHEIVTDNYSACWKNTVSVLRFAHSWSTDPHPSTLHMHCHRLQTAKGLLLNVLEVCLIMGNIQVKFQPLLIPVENNTYKDQIIQIHVDLGLQFGNVFRRLQRLGNLQKCFHRIQNEIHLNQPQNFTRHFFHLVCLIWPSLNWRKRKIYMKLSILYWCSLYSCAC